MRCLACVASKFLFCGLDRYGMGARGLNIDYSRDSSYRAPFDWELTRALGVRGGLALSLRNLTSKEHFGLPLEVRSCELSDVVGLR